MAARDTGGAIALIHDNPSLQVMALGFPFEIRAWLTHHINASRACEAISVGPRNDNTDADLRMQEIAEAGQISSSSEFRPSISVRTTAASFDARTANTRNACYDWPARF